MVPKQYAKALLQHTKGRITAIDAKCSCLQDTVTPAHAFHTHAENHQVDHSAESSSSLSSHTGPGAAMVQSLLSPHPPVIPLHQHQLWKQFSINISIHIALCLC